MPWAAAASVPAKAATPSAPAVPPATPPPTHRPRREAPRLAATADGALPAGAVVTIEPGVYIAGWGGVRIEDDVHLDPAGPRLLTSFTRELLELG